MSGTESEPGSLSEELPQPTAAASASISGSFAPFLGIDFASLRVIQTSGSSTTLERWLWQTRYCSLSSTSSPPLHPALKKKKRMK